MIIVDATIVNVAIPSIIRDLGIGITQAEWANSIYSLVFAALLISVGRVGDVTGRRRVFVFGLVVFLAASLLTALAPSGTVLLFGRFLQGVGGALILPSTLSIVNATFRGRERAIAFGIWGSVIGGMAALGPLVGGWFVTNLSWRWAFYVNLPLGALALAGAFLFVGESRDPDARPGFDLPGSSLSTIGFLGIVFGLIEGQTYGGGRRSRTFLGLSPGGRLGRSRSPSRSASLALAASSSSSAPRARAGRPVLVDFALFRIPSFRYGNVAVLIVGLGELGLVFVIPLFLQSVLGLSAFDTGLVLAALAAGAFVAGGLAAPLTRRIGRAPRRAARTRDRDRRHRRRRPHLLGRPAGVAVLPAAVRLRDRRRLRDRAADERDPRRRPAARSPARDRASRARRGRSARRSASRSSAPRSRPGSPPARRERLADVRRSRRRAAGRDRRRGRAERRGRAAGLPPLARRSSRRSSPSRRHSSPAPAGRPSSPRRSSSSDCWPRSAYGPGGVSQSYEVSIRLAIAAQVEAVLGSESGNRRGFELRARSARRARPRRGQAGPGARDLAELDEVALEAAGNDQLVVVAQARRSDSRRRAGSRAA